jgi:hypothetical protein
VEISLVRHLTRNLLSDFSQIQRSINSEFEGLFTPQLGMIKNVLESYALPIGSDFQLRLEDKPTNRRADLKAMQDLLGILGKRLGYQVTVPGIAGEPILWSESDQVIYSFTVIASAVIGRILIKPTSHGGIRCLVLPGGRAGLLAYKLERDPFLKELSSQWQLLKYRQIRKLAEDASLTRVEWQKELVSDPLIEPEQMKLF